MTKRTRTLLLSMVTVLLAVSLVVGGTYSLFTGTATVNNHLEAGELKVGLKRTNYIAHELGEQGLLVDNTDDTVIDLTADPRTLFNIEKAVPTSVYTAEIEVDNLGDVAFDYGARILWDIDAATEEQKLFAQQILISICNADGSEIKDFTLAACKDKDVGIGYVLRGQSQKFLVKAKFVDSNDNNDVQLITIDFDLQVYAVQKTHLV